MAGIDTIAFVAALAPGRKLFKGLGFGDPPRLCERALLGRLLLGAGVCRAGRLAIACDIRIDRNGIGRRARGLLHGQNGGLCEGRKMLVGALGLLEGNIVKGVHGGLGLVLVARRGTGVKGAVVVERCNGMSGEWGHMEDALAAPMPL